MDAKDVARRVAAGASVALATSGLSSCHNCGGTVVDPPPPPLQCSLLSAGQSLAATGTRSGDSLKVSVRNDATSTWRVDRVGDVVGASLLDVKLPPTGSTDALALSLLLPAGGAQASFTVEATLLGYQGESCTVRRTFHVAVAGSVVQITDLDGDLPLPARDSASIALVSRTGREVELAARTSFAGQRDVSWRVSGGELASSTGSPVRWTLPAVPGIYQAELVIDFGVAGLAVDQLLLEVS